VFHFKAAYSPGWGKLMKEAGRHIDVARARGVDVAADLYVYTAEGRVWKRRFLPGRTKVVRSNFSKG